MAASLPIAQSVHTLDARLIVVYGFEHLQTPELLRRDSSSHKSTREKVGVIQEHTFSLRADHKSTDFYEGKNTPKLGYSALLINSKTRLLKNSRCVIFTVTHHQILF